MERRVLLAVVLCFATLYLWQAFVVPPPKPASTSTTTASAPAAPAPAAPAAAAAVPAVSAPASTPLVAETSERDIVVDTRDVVAVFTNRGARLKSWKLKHFLDGQGQPLELVVNDTPTQPLPFTLRTSDEGVTTTLNTAVYAVQGAPSGESARSAATDLVFEYRDTNGLSARKEFKVEPSSYVVEFRASVARQPEGGTATAIPYSVVWGPAVGDVSETSSYIRKPEGLLMREGEVERIAPASFPEQPTHAGDFPLAGVDDHYFMAAALSPGAIRISYEAVKLPPLPPATAQRDLVSFTIEPPAGSSPTLRYFVGPKDFDVLANINRELVRAIDFGIFAFLVVPLLRSLKWINTYVGNYGWAIVFLTIIINAMMFPLRHKSVVSMRRMQELQPEVKAIQDRYAKFKATDPEKAKMNQELMTLYREKGVNPASGCVPMLLTMPVLIAFYALLSVAIELRGAPFFGWIHDLSRHDPLFVAPILTGVTMVWQQRMTPVAGADPIQQKMMMLMPIIFSVMFLWMPAGVVLYWFISNLWAIGQQYATNYMIGPPNIKTVRPPAERQMKRVGTGKTAAAREP